MGYNLEMNYSRGLENFLKKNAGALPKVVRAVTKNTTEMQYNAQRKAPVDTGFLKRDIHMHIAPNSTNVTGSVSGDADYDPYQEYGTRYMPAHPHIRPAYYEQRDKFRRDMFGVIKGE